MKIQKEDENSNQDKKKKQNDEINGKYQNSDVYNKSNIVKGKILKSDETLNNPWLLRCKAKKVKIVLAK